MKEKFGIEQFLGKFEIDSFRQSLDDNGFRMNLKDNSLTFGIIKNTKNNTFDNALVENDSAGHIKHKEIRAIDKNGDLIYKTLTTDIDLTAILTDSVWYWMKIAHQYSSVEAGTVDVDISGNLVGTGTSFLTTLRGEPDFPTKIKFINAVNNTLEYEILEVIDDNHAILNTIGASVETDLTYAIVGTFTPGKVIPTADKYPIQYDSCLLTYVQEAVAETPPTITNIDLEFYIARVRVVTGVVELQDKRSLYIWRTRADYNFINMSKALYTDVGAKIIGIEAAKYDNTLSPRDKNIVYMGWAFRSSTFSVDPETNKVTLNAGEGGRFKSTSDFADHDFDGFRLYTKDGSYSLIKSSLKTGTDIKLILDTLDYKKYNGITQELLVTPDAEEIEFSFSINPTPTDAELPENIFTFKINERIGKCWLLVYHATAASYNVKYRFKHIDEYSQWSQIPSSIAGKGYYKENQYDSTGHLLVGAIRTDYTSDPVTTFITLLLNPSAYSNFNLGDLIGVNNYSLTEGGVPAVIDLVVGTNKQTEIFTGVKNLAANQKINLVTSGAREGNVFWVKIAANITLNAFTFIITQSATASTAPYFNVLDLTSDYIIKVNTINGITLKLIFNGVNWEIHEFNELETVLNSWVDLDLTGIVTTNANMDGSGTNYPIASIGVNSYFRYKKIGKTCHIQLFLNDVVTNGANDVGAVEINTLPFLSLYKQIGYALCLCQSDTVKSPSGIQPVNIAAGSNKMFFNIYALANSGVVWNTQGYTFTDPAVDLTLTRAPGNSNARWDIQASLTIEIQ